MEEGLESSMKSDHGDMGSQQSSESDGLMEDSYCRPSYFGQFMHLISLLKSLNLLHFFADYVVTDILQLKVSIIRSL